MHWNFTSVKQISKPWARGTRKKKRNGLWHQTSGASNTWVTLPCKRRWDLSNTASEDGLGDWTTLHTPLEWHRGRLHASQDLFFKLYLIHANYYNTPKQLQTLQQNQSKMTKNPPFNKVMLFFFFTNSIKVIALSWKK